MVNLGVDGIVPSNDGGRQLYRAPVPVHLLPRVAGELGGATEICWARASCRARHLRRGGARRAVHAGRHAYLYGLMPAARRGVDRAIEILSGQVSCTMQLLGVTCLEELAPRHVTQLARLGPGVS